MNRDIGIDVVKLNMEEFKKEIDRLEKKKIKKEPYKKKIKKMSLKMVMRCIMDWI